MDIKRMQHIIEVAGITYRYHGKIPALSNVTLAVNEGELFAVIGSNGSGKSTLLHVIDGLIPPSSGTIRFKGEEVSQESLADQRFLKSFRSQVGYIFQDSDAQLFCPTVLDELMFGPLQLAIGNGEIESRIEQVMGMLEINDLRDRPPYMLSAGEKKRVALGAVLTMNPEVLLLDEPTNALDPRTQCALIELVIALNKAGKTIIIATHDLSLVSELGCRVAVLSEEHTIEATGPADEILRNQELLLRVNLIHEHMHFHGSTYHRHVHSHYLLHKHEEEE
jgi:cobalt/nickel transport system ATP-binding protein